MKMIISASKLCAAIFLVASAVPSQAATISFNSTLGGGDINTNGFGANVNVTLLTEFFNSMTVSGAPSGNGTYSSLFLNEVLNANTNVLTMTGTIGSLAGLNVSSTLVTVQLSGPLTANANTSTVSVNKPASVTSITFSATLLADLGLTGSAFALTDLGNTGNICCLNDPNYQNQTSGKLIFDTTTITTNEVPEPRFLPLTALLGALGVFVARKRARASASRS